MSQADLTSHSHNKIGPADRAVLLLILMILAAGILTVANYRFHQQSPGGSDMIPRWLGTRLLILDGLNPYSDEGTRAIQQFYYGHPAGPEQDQVLFVYPLFTAYLFAPFALVEDFPVARAVFMTAMEISLVLFTFISLRLARWRPGPFPLAGIVLFAIFWYHSVRPLINGNAAIFSALFIAAALLAISHERDFIGGFLLAFSSIKPQMVILLIPLIILWGLSRHRWSLVTGIIGSLLLLVLSTMLLVPGWLADNLHQISAYPNYTLPGTPSEIFSQWWPSWGILLSSALSIVLSIVLVWSWRRTWGSEFETLWWSVCLTLALTNLIGIRTTTANYIALLPGLILVLANWQRRWPRYGRWYALVVSLLFFFGLWALFLSTRSGKMQSPILFFPLPIFLIGALLATTPTSQRETKPAESGQSNFDLSTPS